MKKILINIFILTLFAFYAQAQVDRSKAPEPKAAPKIQIGKPQIFELPNGLKVFVVQNEKMSSISYQLSLNINPIMEDDAVGYASMAGQLMTRGTKNRTKEQLDEEIDFIGASLNSSSRGIFASSLKKHQTKLLEMMNDVLMNPIFPDSELEKLKTQAKTNLKSLPTDAGSIASNVRSVVNYGKDHPYGEVQTASHIDNITAAKCKKYYETYFRPNVAYLAIVGDISLDEAKPLVEKYFGNWEKVEVPNKIYTKPKRPSTNQVVFANKPGAVQSLINITYPVDLKPGSPNSIPASVLNKILGGRGFSGRLQQNLREDKAFTYGAYSDLSEDEYIGYFNAYSNVRNEVTDSSVVQFLYEMNGIRNEIMTEEDLKPYLAQMTGAFARSLESPQTIARFAINMEKYNLPADYYETYLTKLNAVTPADVQAMAKKYIKPKNANILVVGNKAEVAEKLAVFSDSEINYYDAFGEKIVEKMPPVPEGVTAQTVIDNYINAIGGRENLEKVKDITMKMSAKMQAGPQEIEINFSSYRKAPNLMLEKQEAMGQIQKKIFDGTKGKANGKEVTGDELEELKLEAEMNTELKYDELGYKLELQGIEKINDAYVYIIQVTPPKGAKYIDYYDKETGLRVRSSRTIESPMGAVTVDSDFGDYKDINGVKYPHKLSQSFGPQSIDLNIDSIEVNTKIKKKFFKF